MRSLLRVSIGLAAAMIMSLLADEPASAQEVIKIGATAALTGPYANVYGVQGKIWDAWTQGHE